MQSSQIPSIINNGDADPMVDTIEIDGLIYSLDDLLNTADTSAEEFIEFALKNIDLAKIAFTDHPVIEKILSGPNYAENLRKIVLKHESLSDLVVKKVRESVNSTPDKKSEREYYLMLIKLSEKDKFFASDLFAIPSILKFLSAKEIFKISTAHEIPITDDETKKKVFAHILLENILYQPCVISKHALSEVQPLEMQDVNYELIQHCLHANSPQCDYYSSQAAFHGHKQAFDHVVRTAQANNNPIVMLSIAEALCANPEWAIDVQSEVATWVADIINTNVDISPHILKQIDHLTVEYDHYEDLCHLYLDLLDAKQNPYKSAAKALGVINPGKGLEAYRKIPAHLLTPVDITEMANFAMMEVWHKQAEEISYKDLDTLNHPDKKEPRIMACLEVLLSDKALIDENSGQEAKLSVIEQFLRELAGNHAQSYLRMENIVLKFCEKSPHILKNKVGYEIVMRYIASPSAYYKIGMLYADASGNEVVGLTTARLWHKASSNMQNGKNEGMTRLLALLARMRASASGRPDSYNVLYLSLKWIIENNRFHHLDFLEEIYQLPECYTEIRVCIAEMLGEKHDDLAKLDALEIKRQLASYQDIQKQLLALETSVATLPPCHVTIRRRVEMLKHMELTNNIEISQIESDMLVIKQRNQDINALQAKIAELPIHHQRIRDEVARLQTTDQVDDHHYDACRIHLESDMLVIKQRNQDINALQAKIAELPIHYQRIRDEVARLQTTDQVDDRHYDACRIHFEGVKQIVADIASLHARATLLPDRFIAIKKAINQCQDDEVLQIDNLNIHRAEIIKIENSLRMQTALQPKIACLPNHYRYIRNEFDDAENRLTSNEVEMQRLANKVKALSTHARLLGAKQAAMNEMLLPLAKLEKKLNRQHTKTKKECIQLEVVSQLHHTLRHQIDAHFTQDFSDPKAIKHDAFRDNCIKLIKSQLEDSNKGLKNQAGWQKRLAAWLIRQLQRIFPNSLLVNEWVKSTSAHFKVAPKEGVEMCSKVSMILK